MTNLARVLFCYQLDDELARVIWTVISKMTDPARVLPTDKNKITDLEGVCSC